MVLHNTAQTDNCIIKTFVKEDQYCKPVQIQDQQPFFTFYGTQTFFSVKQPTQIKISCKEPGQQNKVELKILEYSGQFTLNPSCTVILPDNRKYHSNPILEGQVLNGPNFISILANRTANPTDFVHKIPTLQNLTTLPPLHFKPLNFNVDTILSELTDPIQNATSLVRGFFSTTFIFFLILAICICSPKFRNWFTACLFMKNPKKYWIKYKGYDISDFTKKHKKIHEKLKAWQDRKLKDRQNVELNEINTNDQTNDFDDRLYPLTDANLTQPNPASGQLPDQTQSSGLKPNLFDYPTLPREPVNLNLYQTLPRQTKNPCEPTNNPYYSSLRRKKQEHIYPQVHFKNPNADDFDKIDVLYEPKPSAPVT